MESAGETRGFVRLIFDARWDENKRRGRLGIVVRNYQGQLVGAKCSLSYSNLEIRCKLCNPTALSKHSQIPYTHCDFDRFFLFRSSLLKLLNFNLRSFIYSYRCSQIPHSFIPRFCVTEPPSPTAAAANGGVNSPHSWQRSLHSPWASIVRGDSGQIPSSVAPGPSLSPPPEQPSAADDFAINNSGSEAQPENSDVEPESNAGRSRRLAWSRPSNGIVEPGSVMGGAGSWPTLSELSRPIHRSSSDSSRPVLDESAPLPQAPVISQPPPQRQANTSAHANSTANNTTKPRSRSRSGGGGGGSSSGSGPSHNTFNRPSTPAPPSFPTFEIPYGIAPPMLETPVTGTRPVRGVGGSQSHTGNDHSSQRNTSRRGNFGPRPRGDGSYHNSHGGRRDQDRRDVHLPPQYMPPPVGYMPTPMPPGGVPFMAPPPVRLFPGQMGFDMASPFMYIPTIPSPESFRAMQMVSPQPPPMLFPTAIENSLTNMIVKQIDYYFSDDNLVKDSFLRSKMDNHGWVPITLIASFRRVNQLTKDISVIMDSLRYSTIVEVQGDKVRRRNEWKRWLHPWVNNESGLHDPENVLATSLQEVSLNDSNGNMATGRPLSRELTGQSRLANGGDTAEQPRTTSF